MSKLESDWLEAKRKYDKAVKDYGRGSRVALTRWQDMAAITARILRRDMKRRAA